MDQHDQQESIRQQILLLQSQLIQPKSPPRRKATGITLAPSTPSPRKNRKVDVPRQAAKPMESLPAMTLAPPPPSNVVSKMASMSRQPGPSQARAVLRSSGFSEPPPQCPKRDEDLALIEEFELGPKEHTAPFTDPNFDRVEPNSGIRLSSRILPHDDLQDHIRGRYYISPSRLYSCIRLLPNKQGYDVPVDGDWMTIAVVAERGTIKYTKPPATLTADDEADGKKGKQKEDLKQPSGRKYINIKLVDFGSRTHSSATGGKGVIGGDALLSLLLFEAESCDLVTREGCVRPTKIYKGGSRGAFESLARVKEGDVVAILNPKILKPFQRATDRPDPLHNALGITPENAESILVIGRSRDLALCPAIKQDGSACGSWCDKRISDVCEWHVQRAVQKGRSQRAEFSSGTSGMGSSAIHKRKHASYDPQRQWGLKPEDDSTSGSTYVVSGHVISAAEKASMFVSETVGREVQAKARRKAEASDADKAVKALLEREGKKRKTSHHEDDLVPKSIHVEAPAVSRRSFSAAVIQDMGFDPTATSIGRRPTGGTTRKLDTLKAVQSLRRKITLEPRPGPRIRSGVAAPKVNKSIPAAATVDTTLMIDLDDI